MLSVEGIALVNEKCVMVMCRNQNSVNKEGNSSAARGPLVVL